MMVEEQRFLPATTFSAMDPSSQIHWGPNRERQAGERRPQGEEKKHLCGRANRQTVSYAQQGAEEQSAPCTQQSERGSRGKKKKRKAGVTKSWERREKSELDMGLCVAPLWFLLLICLSQAELGRLWAAEQEGKSSSRHKQLLQMHPVNYICTFLQTDCQVFYLTRLSDWELHV